MLQLEEAILTGQFKPGEKLPSERELKEVFQVGRGAVREALRILEQKGLLEIRLGAHGGAIVKKPSGEPMLETLALLLRRQEIPFTDIQEFRSSVESNIASLAAERRNDQDIQKLQSIVRQAQLYLGTEYDWDSFLQEDAHFHQELARIARNQLFALIADSLHNNIHEYYASRLKKKRALLEENYADLVAICDAVRDGDPERAAGTMQRHVVSFDAHMRNPG